ncbi:facilitated trehalose transporter Tret1-like [Oratosquilla oratoria]|uniref:facilitated trehalose transporter Tret1-like n=1 Tax=Oratosquilla oratoria TaxID=337810 RepID=UPI003F759A4E
MAELEIQVSPVSHTKEDNNGLDDDKSKANIVKDDCSHNGCEFDVEVEEQTTPIGSRMEDGEMTQSQRPDVMMQVLGSLAAALPYMSVSSAVIYSGITLPQFTSSDATDIVLEDSTTALFSSLTNMGSILGALVAGPSMVIVGQRRTLLLALPATLACWLGVAFANSVSLLLVFRFLLGATVGVLETAPYTYVAEISYKDYRGSLSGIIEISRGVGMISYYAIGTSNLTWRQLALVAGITTTVPSFIGLLFMHDSPRWLASKGYNVRSDKALQFFRGNKYKIDQERKDILEQVKGMRHTNHNVVGQIKQLQDPSILKRFSLLMLMTLLWQWGGNVAILAYTVVIFGETNSCSSAAACSILVGVGRTVGSLVFFSLTDCVGRRPGFIVSSLGCSASMFSLGLYFYFKNEFDNGEMIVAGWTWLPSVAVLAFTFFIASVIGVSNILPGELLPLSFRLIGKGMSTVFNWIVVFSVSYMFVPLKNTFGLHGAFWTYAICGFLSAAIPLLLPETKGKSLEEIETIFKHR